MRKKILCFALLMTLLMPTLTLFSFSYAATEDEIELSVIAGLEWLASMQEEDGSWPGYESVAKTGLAVLKFIDRARERGINPCEEGYEYYMQVLNGLDYILLHAHTIGIIPQPAGNPDLNGNDIGVYFDIDGHISYTTGICLMAIGSAETCVNELGLPEPVVGSGPLAGWTYEEVIQDTVEYLAFGQNDEDWERGGWGYVHNYG